MSITMKWGLITGMVYVIISLISNLMGLQQGGGGSMGLGMLVNILTLGVTFYTTFLGIKEYRNVELGGFLTMGQAFKKGLTIALIAGLIAGAFTIIYMTLIDPGMGERMLEQAEDKWEKDNMPEEQREMSRKITGIFLNPAITGPFLIIWICIGGMIKSLIAGAILKKEAPPTVPMA